jgi:hypothetical protein
MINILQTSEVVRAAFAVIGVISVYLGYRLFCDISYPEISYSRTSARRSTVRRNLAAGALLAIFGLGMLVADARGMRNAAHRAHPAWQRKSTEEGSFGVPKFNRRTGIIERLV